MSGVNWPTLTVAIIGAVTGVLSLGWNIYVHASDRVQLKLEYALAYGLLSEGEGWYITITAANPSHHPVTVGSVGFDLSNGRQLLFPPNPQHPVPFEVTPGRAYQAWALHSAVKRGLREAGGPQVAITHVWANDATGKKWRQAVRKGWNLGVKPGVVLP